MKIILKLKLIAVGMIMALTSLNAQETLKPFNNVWTADQGDGTYINPIVNADFPDCDIPIQWN